jgi:hypothetical protein
MLLVSAKNNEVKVDIQGVNGNEEAAGLGVGFGVELMKFAESLALDEEETLAIARERLVEEAGEAVLVDAAGVAANFQRMVRIADAIGIPVDDVNDQNRKQVWEELGLESFLLCKIHFDVKEPGCWSIDVACVYILNCEKLYMILRY